MIVSNQFGGETASLSCCRRARLRICSGKADDAFVKNKLVCNIISMI